MCIGYNHLDHALPFILGSIIVISLTISLFRYTKHKKINSIQINISKILLVIVSFIFVLYAAIIYFVPVNCV